MIQARLSTGYGDETAVERVTYFVHSIRESDTLSPRTGIAVLGAGAVLGVVVALVELRP